MASAKKKTTTSGATKPDPTLAAVRAVVAKSCAPDVVAFFEGQAKKPLRALGLWRLASQEEMLAAPAPAAPFHDRAAIAAATNTLYLGKDGGGMQFYVMRSKVLSEVFIHDPGAGQLALLATSLAAFVELNELIAQWDELCEAEDCDPDPEGIEDGSIDFALPAFAALRARAKALKGRVNLVAGSDYDATVCALAKTTLRAKSTSDVVALYKRHKHAKLARP